MVTRSCTFSTDANAEKYEFVGTKPIRLILTFDDEYIVRKFRFRRGDIVIMTVNTERAIAISSQTPLLQVLVT